MAKAGDVIEHPIRGETIRFLETARESGGDRLRIEVTVRGESRGAGSVHIHPSQIEEFRVLQGRIRVQVADEQSDLAEGDEVAVPAGTVHTFWNPFPAPARVAVEVRPALRLETLAETDFGLARAGRVSRTGEMKLLQAAVTLTEFAGELRPPQWYVRILLRVLAPVGRLFGYRPYYAEYGVPPKSG
jgi:mannose-6-phosphate isomerase-like protein (cupin superfamily)